MFLRFWLMVLLVSLLPLASTAFFGIPPAKVGSRASLQQPCFPCQWQREPSCLVVGELHATATPPDDDSSLPTLPQNSTTTAKRRSWKESYALLQEFQQEHGHTDVPYPYKKDPILGAWVRRQRARKAVLPKRTFERLEALNFTWSEVNLGTKNDTRWQEMFEQLLDYKEKHGDCLVPVVKDYKPNPQLRHWVQNQRRHYQLQILDSNRIEQLDSVGFVWRINPYVERKKSKVWDKAWEQKYQELVLYRKKNGDANVPGAWKENPKLSSWVEGQRRWFARGRLRADRIEKLENIDFAWTFDDMFDEAWQSMFQKLKQLKGQERNQVYMTWASQYDQPHLHCWEQRQQEAYLQGTLYPEREKLLEEIGYFQSYWNSDNAEKDVG